MLEEDLWRSDKKLQLYIPNHDNLKVVKQPSEQITYSTSIKGVVLVKTNFKIRRKMIAYNFKQKMMWKGLSTSRNLTENELQWIAHLVSTMTSP